MQNHYLKNNFGINYVQCKVFILVVLQFLHDTHWIEGWNQREKTVTQNQKDGRRKMRKIYIYSKFILVWLFFEEEGNAWNLGEK